MDKSTQRPQSLSINVVTGTIITAALKVHSNLGPGLLEGTYQKCLAHELSSRGIIVQSELLLPVTYAGIKVDAGYRVDLLVENLVIVEVKAVEQIRPIHYAQLLSYLKLSGKRVGLLINFNVRRLIYGIKRLAN